MIQLLQHLWVVATIVGITIGATVYAMESNRLVEEIENQSQYLTAMAECSELVRRDPPKDSRAGRRLLALAEAIEKYEKSVYKL